MIQNNIENTVLNEKQEWDENFEKFKLIFQNKNANYLDISTIEEQLTSEEIYDWIKKQIFLYKINFLEYDKVKKFQEIKFIEEKERFNIEDEKIYKKFCNDLELIIQKKDRKIMEFIKSIIEKYYHSKDGKIYNLDDYIQVCLISIFNVINSNYHSNSYFYRIIVNELKKIHTNVYEYEIYNDVEIPDVYMGKSIDDVIDTYNIENIFKYVIDYSNEKLTEMERKVIFYYYGFDNNRCYSINEISKIVGISNFEVYQIEKKVLNELRKYITDYKNINNDSKNNIDDAKDDLQIIMEQFLEKTKVIISYIEENNLASTDDIFKLKEQIFEGNCSDLECIKNTILEFYKLLDIKNSEEFDEKYYILKNEYELTTKINEEREEFESIIFDIKELIQDIKRHKKKDALFNSKVELLFKLKKELKKCSKMLDLDYFENNDDVIKKFYLFQDIRFLNILSNSYQKILLSYPEKISNEKVQRK